MPGFSNRESIPHPAFAPKLAKARAEAMKARASEIKAETSLEDAHEQRILARVARVNKRKEARKSSSDLQRVEGPISKNYYSLRDRLIAQGRSPSEAEAIARDTINQRIGPDLATLFTSHLAAQPREGGVPPAPPQRQRTARTTPFINARKILGL